ncbi:hypothetical protein BO94DRAFT_590409 [Aspergillus sclerotioniger CBS 115572]|uniref:Uncharacterized protein n=1 Tax=Aspergillus sclerotioniger CBS 115572 TaxID=1450535 RepID=A0A317V6G5_9EURO|nr:hypothetical protein BO94DRAFT_590409 [Aspergillus sclerotioniger CBS 115572]PWY69625.1 hypothetical protein BO94DRAFT_590409 [Aspergillus sclerotioniger CBS 115572]
MSQQQSLLVSYKREYPTRVIIVPMNAVQSADLNQMVAIGTRDLGGCSTVVIASKTGAILAHLPPRPSMDLSDPFTGDSNVRRLMTQVVDLYHAHRDKYFATITDTVIVCAFHEGEIALQDQVQIMTTKLQGLGPEIYTYQVPVQHGIPGRGTVAVVGSQGFVTLGLPDRPRPLILVEDMVYVPRHNS